jgi:hypothetical protein
MSRAKTGIERVTAYAHSAPLAEVETAYLVFGTILRARHFGETDVPGKAPDKFKPKAKRRPRKAKAGPICSATLDRAPEDFIREQEEAGNR